MIPKPTYIYHITDVANLDSILNNKGLISYNQMLRNDIIYTNIAHGNIQDMRANRKVPLPPFGNLHDYVPFYFGPRSPMLYTISRGNVAGYTHGQGHVIYLVTTVEEINRMNYPFVFTDGHAIMVFSAFFNNIDYLNYIDWDIMFSQYWNDTVDYPDRKRKRQAEFLVYQSLSWQSIKEIGVIDERMKQFVTAIIQKNRLQTPVYVRPEWYY